VQPRVKRTAAYLPTAWDDLQPRRERTWKATRKTQYNNQENHPMKRKLTLEDVPQKDIESICAWIFSKPPGTSVTSRECVDAKVTNRRRYFRVVAQDICKEQDGRGPNGCIPFKVN
jgi:hypothetical protein